MSAKYYISFTSNTGLDNRIEFDIEGYEGDPIELDGAGCSIIYDGEDMMDPVITSRTTLRVNYHEQFFADTRDADDKQIPVTIYHGDSKWIGFLISDNRDETFDKTNYPIELTCVDPFSYIRGLQKDLFRDTNLFGRQSIETVIRAVFEPVLDVLNIELLNDTLPDGGTGTILNSTYCFTQVFQDDNGLFINGYDIIEKIMTDLVMTAIFFNGTLILRNNRFLEGRPTTEIGLSEDGDSIFWIGNNELVTRTRGAKETSRSLSYPDMVSMFSNPFFYYVSSGNPVGWVKKSLPWYDCTNIEYIGTGRERNPYGFRLTGIMKFDTTINEGKENGPVSSTTVVDVPIATSLEPVNFVLRIKYRYGRYPIVLNDDGDPRRLNLAVNVICTDSEGTMLYYSNEGKTGIGNYPVFPWQTYTSNSLPRVYFPVENTEEIQEVEISIANPANHSLVGPVTYSVILWNMGAFNDNDSLMFDGGGYAAFPNTVEYFKADLAVTRDGDAYYNGNRGIDSYTSEEVYLTNNRNLSLIKDTIDMTIGRSYYINGRDESQNIIKTLDKLNKASLTLPDGSAIETFSQASAGYSNISLLEYGAKSDMYFNRMPRYQVDAAVLGDVNIKQVFSSPKVIPGKYVCVKDEYDLYLGTHSMTLQELRGSDEDDIIENFLSSN